MSIDPTLDDEVIEHKTTLFLVDLQAQMRASNMEMALGAASALFSWLNALEGKDRAEIIETIGTMLADIHHGAPVPIDVEFMTRNSKAHLYHAAADEWLKAQMRDRTH